MSTVKPDTQSATAADVRLQTVTGRIPVTDVQPVVLDGRFPAKAVVGEDIPVRATVFREGHDSVRATVRLLDPAGAEVQRVQMRSGRPGLDEVVATLRPAEPGLHQFVVEGWDDPVGTWKHAATVKIAAGVDVELMLAEGAALFRRAAEDAERSAEDRAVFEEVVRGLEDESLIPAQRLASAESAEVSAVLHARPVREHLTSSELYPLDVQRELAGRGAWYEFFPRSEGARRFKNGTVKSGTFRTAKKRLPGVAGMGFDVVYLPPIHPIGRVNRKGRNNTLEALPGDPGSPYAIGAAEGGHDAIHPELGTVADFRSFVRAAEKEGLEVALDLALQAAPDHPWVTEHPEWFTVLPDGTIAYAENPPKKYQDIYPLNFDTDPEGIYAEMLRIVRYWIAQGVKIFRVDNPHTKPLQFWEWLIATVNAEDPDVIFLAEAFTRPAVMQSLAMVGFQQSYSYFTWRNTKEELEEFLSSISNETSDFMRPNLFVNTHDILTQYLQYGGRPAYKIRAAIAATAGATYGVYAGYELYENVARPGSEENIDNEKYEFKFRDWEKAEADGDSLAPYLRRLNEIRRAHPALRQLRGLSVHWSDDDAILVYSKHLPAAVSESGVADTIVVVANVDPHSARQTMVHLDPRAFGIEPGESFEVEDLITGATWTWSTSNFVRLDSFTEPVHILHVKGTR